jgi:hypothetical protein
VGPAHRAKVNDYEARIAKVAGEFAWHRHDETDEFFLAARPHHHHDRARPHLSRPAPGDDVAASADGGLDVT